MRKLKVKIKVHELRWVFTCGRVETESATVMRKPFCCCFTTIFIAGDISGVEKYRPENLAQRFVHSWLQSYRFPCKLNDLFGAF